MAFCGTLLFYRWTAATPLSEAPSDVQEVLKYFDTTCATLRIPHRVTIKNAQDEGTDCALVNVFGLDDLHYRRLEHCIATHMLTPGRPGEPVSRPRLWY